MTQLPKHVTQTFEVMAGIERALADARKVQANNFIDLLLEQVGNRMGSANLAAECKYPDLIIADRSGARLPIGFQFMKEPGADKFILCEQIRQPNRVITFEKIGELSAGDFAETLDACVTRTMRGGQNADLLKADHQFRRYIPGGGNG